MRLGELAEALARLDKVQGRLVASSIVAEVLNQASPTELEPVVYLLQGRLRPAFEAVEFGVGERLLIRMLARTYGESGTAVTRRYKQLGDLGLVAETLATRKPRVRLSVKRAYAHLLEVAHAAGAGAVERKTRLLTELLERATPIEARYLVRIVQGRLRLGLGDATILEAAAAGALGDRRRKPLIEQAYNVRSDLGGVVKIAYARGARGLARVTPEHGVPVRPSLAQRLPSAAAILARHGMVWAEPKYDGFRLQLHRDGDRVWAFSRRLQDVTAMFPEVTAALPGQLKVRRAILEGEAVGYEPKSGRFLPFQVTMTRKRKHRIAEAAARHPIRLFAFDLLYAGGTNYLPKPQRVRSRRLATVLRNTGRGTIAVTESLTTERPTELQRYFEAMVHRGLEGIVAKRPDAPYRAGARGFDWIKLKKSYQSRLRDTVDLVLIGYLKGRGKRAALGIGSLLGAVYDPKADRFRTVAKIGSGPSEEGWRALRRQMDLLATPARPKRVDSKIVPDVWVEPKLVTEVLADEITRSPSHTCGQSGADPGYALRFPRLLNGPRSDRAAEDATTEREILQMYGMQGRTGTRRRRARVA